MSDPFKALSDDERQRLRPTGHPDWIAPTLATLTHDHFSDPAWLYERKLDGQRCLAFRHGDRLRLLSRSKQKLNGTYPELVEALERQDAADFVVDGEVVAFAQGLTSFARLQQRLGISDPAEARRRRVAVYFYLFDLLHLDGHDTRRLPLRARKSLLRQALSFTEPLRFTAHQNETGEAMYRDACAKGWEGIIAKRADAPYHSGRGTQWLKFKCSASQELVIGGFTEPSGSRVGLGALLVGYYDGDDLVYAGKVGTGYDQQTLRDLRARLDDLATDESPFARNGIRERRAHWARPELVAEIAFTEWTSDGKLRHPRFQGLRQDKKPTDVVREQPH
jgi:bifunctional non-homologous end joining protein LigD